MRLNLNKFFCFVGTTATTISSFDTFAMIALLRLRRFVIDTFTKLPLAFGRSCLYLRSGCNTFLRLRKRRLVERVEDFFFAAFGVFKAIFSFSAFSASKRESRSICRRDILYGCKQILSNLGTNSIFRYMNSRFSKKQRRTTTISNFVVCIFIIVDDYNIKL